MGDQPYQFGDVVDGYRWTITGWEPVEAPERTVGVPRLLEKRYAATQEAQARQQTQAQTLEEPASVVVVDEPGPEPFLDDVTPTTDAARPASGPEPAMAGAGAPETVEEPPALSLDEILGGGRTVVAAPDLAVTFDESDAVPYADPPSGAATMAEAEGTPEPLDAEPASARAWYGLGLEPVYEPIEETVEATSPPASDDAFAAALELGARTFAEHYQPSEIEIAAGIASGASRPTDPWRTSLAPWTIDEQTVAPETLDAHDAAYGTAPEADAAASATEAEEPAPRPVTFSPPPPAGWYPGSV